MPNQRIDFHHLLESLKANHKTPLTNLAKCLHTAHLQNQPRERYPDDVWNEVLPDGRTYGQSIIGARNNAKKSNRKAMVKWFQESLPFLEEKKFFGLINQVIEAMGNFGIDPKGLEAMVSKDKRDAVVHYEPPPQRNENGLLPDEEEALTNYIRWSNSKMSARAFNNLHPVVESRKAARH